MRRRGGRAEREANCCAAASHMRRKKEQEAGPAPAPRAATLPPGPAPCTAARSGRDHFAQAGAAAPPAGAAASTAATPGPRPHPLLQPGARHRREPRESGERGAGLTELRPPQLAHRLLLGLSNSKGAEGREGREGREGCGTTTPSMQCCEAAEARRRGVTVYRSRSVKASFCFLCLKTWFC